MKKAFGVIAVVTVAAFIVVLIFSKKMTDAVGRRQLPGALTIFYTCDTRGHIEPCGCAAGMEGGISRRQYCLSKNLPADYLLVDAGDVTAGPRPWELLELEYLLKGYDMMGYHAVNAGHREVSVDYDDLTAVKQKYNRMVSANLFGPDGDTVFAPYIIVELGGGGRAGIIGIADDKVEPEDVGRGLSLLAPEDSLRKYLPKIKDQCDMIVLLAFADEKKMKSLADQFFEIDVIVGGRVLQASQEPVTSNQSVIVYNTGKGKSLGKLDVVVAKDGSFEYSNDFFVLAESMERDGGIADLVEEYKRQLQQRDFRVYRDDQEGLSSISASRSKTANRYVGGQNCKSCHSKAYEVWSGSAHAHAFDSLELKGHQFNPRCLSCHTVGYMASDGYINQKLTPNLKNVSCESCHGRGAHHAKLKSGADIGAKKVFMKNVKCMQCHDQENSPLFEYSQYWEKIKHGKE